MDTLTGCFQRPVGVPEESGTIFSDQSGPTIISFAAVIKVVTQRFSPLSGGEALRDDPNNGRRPRGMALIILIPFPNSLHK